MRRSRGAVGDDCEEKENRVGHHWVKNEDWRQRACKTCVNALTPDERRAFSGHEKVENKNCSYRNCGKMALCKKHFEEKKGN